MVSFSHFNQHLRFWSIFHSRTTRPPPANDSFDVAMNGRKKRGFFNIDEPLNDFIFLWILADYQIAVCHIIFLLDVVQENGAFLNNLGENSNEILNKSIRCRRVLGNILKLGSKLSIVHSVPKFGTKVGNLAGFHRRWCQPVTIETLKESSKRRS